MSAHAPILYWFPGVAAMGDVPPYYVGRCARGRSFAGSSLGPDAGTRGLLLAPRTGVATVYAPDRQRWTRLPGGAVWIGARLGATPADFARPTQLPGTPVVLGDGQYWSIPVANPLVPSCALPACEVLSEEGGWELEVKAEYHDLSLRAADLAAEVRAGVLAGGPATVRMGEGAFRALVGDVLALNYDLTLLEFMALRVLDPACYPAVVSAFLDLPAMIALLVARVKEIGEAGPTAALHPTAAPGALPSTAPGAPATAPTTAPPAPTTGS